ncbi:MAG: hypothetical protein N2688_13170 [Burkholderiaceae bacterium]|nr:hypothetical protein [Burkholderiaceae bacterium]
MLYRTFERLIGAATAACRDVDGDRLQALALVGSVARGPCEPQELLRRSLDDRGAWLAALGAHSRGTGRAAYCDSKPDDRWGDRIEL